MGYLFTSESVSEGHPDKVADQISDAILDAYLAIDPESHVAVETLVTSNLVVLAGEILVNDEARIRVNRERVARGVIRDIGYVSPALKFCHDTVAVIDQIHRQSENIRKGVDAALDKEQGAGDQGMMFGYACREIDAPTLMPMPLYYAHRLVEELAYIRKETCFMSYLGPDAKSQVTIEYDNNRKPIGVHTVVLSTLHSPGIPRSQIQKDIEEWLLPRVFTENFWPAELIINPAGDFDTGGPHADTGLTGRKIIVDTYGGRGAHGGGAFSGKDPSKVDRSAAYALRHAAKNLVAAELAGEVVLQVAYAIGKPRPVSVVVDSSGTVSDGLTDDDLCKIVTRVFDLAAAQISDRLDLKRPIYRKTAAYGHFGRADFPWEALDHVDKVRACAEKIRNGLPL